MGLLLLPCPVSTCSVIISTLPSTTRNTNLPLPSCTYSLLLLTPISSLSSSISLAASGVFVCAVKETGSVRMGRSAPAFSSNSASTSSPTPSSLTSPCSPSTSLARIQKSLPLMPRKLLRRTCMATTATSYSLLAQSSIDILVTSSVKSKISFLAPFTQSSAEDLLSSEIHFSLWYKLMKGLREVTLIVRSSLHRVIPYMPGLLPTSVYFVRFYALDTPRVSPLWSASFNGVSWLKNCIVMSDKYT